MCNNECNTFGPSACKYALEGDCNMHRTPDGELRFMAMGMLKRFGSNAQMLKTAEEAAEFAARACKFASMLSGTHELPHHATDQLAEEYVDLFEVMLPQFLEIMRHNATFWHSVEAHRLKVKDRLEPLVCPECRQTCANARGYMCDACENMSLYDEKARGLELWA